jgi:type IV pilus assembly protein PilW
MTGDWVRKNRGGRGRTAQRGLSLVELLVALTVGLFLLGAVGSIYVATSQSTRGSTQEAQMNEDANLALEILQQQVRLAGFSGFRAGAERNFQAQALFGCNGAFNDVNEGDFNALACANNGANTNADAFVVRYEATLLNSQPVTPAGGGGQLPANCVHEGIAPWFAAGAANVSVAENRYFVAPDPANNNVPSLRCRGRVNAAGFSNVNTVIPNIEDMQILYAVTRLPAVDDVLPHQITGYLRADEVTALPTVGGIGPWSRVAGLRICLVARSTERFAALPEELRQYVDCTGARVTAPNDGLIRRAYTTTVMARNLRPGLPAAFVAGANPWDLITGVSND